MFAISTVQHEHETDTKFALTKQETNFADFIIGIHFARNNDICCWINSLCA